MKTTDILIAGCGYAGLRAALAWRDQGQSVSVITRSESRARQFLEQGLHPVVGFPGSVTVPAARVVLWSVGYDRQTERRSVWVDGLASFLKSLRNLDQIQRVLYTSSTGVYGDCGGDDVDEFTPTAPTSEGGIVCVEAEKKLRDFQSASGVPVSILRLAGIYGPDRLLRRVEDLRAQVPLTSSPDDWLNLIHVDDVVRMIDCVASIPGRSETTAAGSDPLTVLNVVASESVTRGTYYSTLARLLQTPPPVFAGQEDLQGQAAPGSRVRSGNRRVVSRLRQNLPVRFRFDQVSEGLEHAIANSRNLK